MRSIKRDFRALGGKLKNLGAQVVFSSILPVMRGDFGRNRQASDINTWLQDWCLCQNFGFLNRGRAFGRQGMLRPDGIYLSQGGNVSLGASGRTDQESFELESTWGRG